MKDDKRKGNAANAHLRADLLRLLSIDLGKAQTVLHLACKLSKYRSHHFASGTSLPKNPPLWAGHFGKNAQIGVVEIGGLACEQRALAAAVGLAAVVCRRECG